MEWVTDDPLLTIANETRITHISDNYVADKMRCVHAKSTICVVLEQFYNMLRNNVYALNRVDNLLRFMDVITPLYSEIVVPFIDPLLDSLYLEFINESLDFLETGKRKTDLMVYNNLLTTYSTFGYDMSKLDNCEKQQLMLERDQLVRRIKSMRKISNVRDLVSYINMWCSHRGGFRDLVVTLYLLHRDSAYGVTQYQP